MVGHEETMEPAEEEQFWGFNHFLQIRGGTWSSACQRRNQRQIRSDQ